MNTEKEEGATAEAAGAATATTETKVVKENQPKLKILPNQYNGKDINKMSMEELEDACKQEKIPTAGLSLALLKYSLKVKINGGKVVAKKPATKGQITKAKVNTQKEKTNEMKKATTGKKAAAKTKASAPKKTAPTITECQGFKVGQTVKFTPRNSDKEQSLKIEGFGTSRGGYKKAIFTFKGKEVMKKLESLKK